MECVYVFRQIQISYFGQHAMSVTNNFFSPVNKNLIYFIRYVTPEIHKPCITGSLDVMKHWTMEHS